MLAVLFCGGARLFTFPADRLLPAAKYRVAYAPMRARKIVRGLEEGLTVQNAVADHVVRQLKERGAWTRRENGDHAANCGHFGGIVLSEDRDGEQTDDTGSQG